MVEELISMDIEDLRQQLMNEDYFLIDAILRGDAGWKQYAYLTDKEVEAEYKERILMEENFSELELRGEK